MSVSQQVLVNFEYTYTARDGTAVSIRPNEHYILIAKTNENWWHVRRDETAKPFYIPAKYVTELPPENSQTPLKPPEEFSGCDSPPSVSQRSSSTANESVEVTLRDPASIKRDTEKDGHRVSTYIIPKEFFEPKVLEVDSIETEANVNILPNLQINETSSNHSFPKHLLPHIDIVNTQSSETDMIVRENQGENLQVDLKILDEDVQMIIRAEQGLTEKENVYESIEMVTKPESPTPEDNPAETVNLLSPATVLTSLTPDEATVRETLFIYISGQHFYPK